MRKLNLRTRQRSLLPFLLALALAAGALVGLTTPAGAAGPAEPQPANSTTLPANMPAFTPPQHRGVAIAEIATVRLVATYTLNPKTGVTLPAGSTTAACTGEGVLVASFTPDGTKGKVAVLTDSMIISPSLSSSCLLDLPATLQAMITSGTFKSLIVYLNTAFSGTTPIMLPVPAAGDLAAALAPVAGLTLLTLPITPVAGGMFQDEPTVTLQSRPTTNSTDALDLTNQAGSSLTTKDLNPGTGKTAPDASQFLTPQVGSISSAAGNTPLAGTPVIDSQTGELVSMLDSAGTAIPASEIALALNGLEASGSSLFGSCPQAPAANCLGNRWSAVMGQYYPLTQNATKGQPAAKTNLQQLASDYSATFKGAQDFVSALQTPTSGSHNQNHATPCPTFLGVCTDTAYKIGLGVLGVLVLMVILLTVLIYGRKILGSRAKKQAEMAMDGFPVRKSGPMAYAGPQAPGAAASYGPPAQALPAQRLVICPNCHTQNNAGSSNCVKCGHELLQGVGGVSGVGRSGLGRSTSGGGQKLNLPSNPPPVYDVSEVPTQVYQMGMDHDATDPTQPDLAAIRMADEQPTIQRRPMRVPPAPTHPAYGVKVSTKSDTGKKRAGKENEDNYLAVTGTWAHNGQMQPFGLFVVADGMGGHANGQDASKMAIETIYHSLAEQLPKTDVPDDQLATLLQQAVQAANKMIYDQNQRDHADMGCTLTAALVSGNEATICNVGDSRTYVLPMQDHLHRVTTDHSIVESLVQAGVISKDDVYTHPKRNQIYRSLGDHEAAEVDVFHQQIGAGDKLLLCCDGLWEMIRDPAIEQVLRHDDLSQVSSDLINMANENGGVDNITAIVVKVTDEVKNPKGPMIQDVASGPSGIQAARR